MKNIKTNWMLVILFCLYVYSFTLGKWAFVGYIITYIIPGIFIMKNIKTSRYLLDKKMISCVLIYIFLLCVVIITPIIHGTHDFSYIKTFTYVIRKLLIYWFLAIAIGKVYKEKSCIEIYMYYFCIATVCYVLVTILFIICPQIKDIWFEITDISITEGFQNSYGYTARIGWMGFSGFRQTLKCSISAIFIMYLFCCDKSKIKLKKPVFIICLLLSVLGNAFYGRTGIAVTAVSAVMSLVLYKKLKIKVLINSVLILVLMIIVFSVIRNYNEKMNEWYMWMLSPFINFITTGDFNSSSFNTMTGSMLFFPGLKTLLAGDGYFMVNGGYYKQTDLGFMRQILYWGIFNTLLTYILTLMTIFKMKKHNLALVLIIALCFITFEFKGEVYYEFIPLMMGMYIVNGYDKYVFDKILPR